MMPPGTRIAVRERVRNPNKEALMSEQNRYRGNAQRGPNRTGESQWQRDYGERTQHGEQRFDSPGRASYPRPEDPWRNSDIERDLRDNEYPTDRGYARDDRFPLDFGASEDRDFSAQSREREYRAPNSYGSGGYSSSGYGSSNYSSSNYGSGNYGSGRNFQTQRQPWDDFGNRPRGETNRASGLQAASFYGRGPKGYQRSDERIREDVCERLSDNDEVDASDIEVTVRDREVTLEGSVETRRMKHLSEDIAESVSGVDDVHNRITVRKAFLKDMADRVLGNETSEHHAHSGTKTTGATPSAVTGASPSSGTRAANGHT